MVYSASKVYLQRTFGILPLVGFSCTVLSTWEALIGSDTPPLGGPAGAFYTFIFAWIGTCCCCIVISELASMYSQPLSLRIPTTITRTNSVCRAPTSGGQYHWCAMLAPTNWMKPLSYLTGWLALIGWQSTFAAALFMGSTVLQGVITLAHRNYRPTLWQATMISWAKALFYLALNLMGGKPLSRLESLFLLFHILAFFALSIPMIYMSEHQSADQVFLHFINKGNFASNTLACFIGMIGCASAFSGADATVHMAEEALNAAVAIPRAIMLSLMINGLLGFGILLSLLFCISNIDDVLSTKTKYPFLEIFYQATGSVGGTIGMHAIMQCTGIAATTGTLAATSRQLWSFSRDRAVPGWRLWSRVSARGMPTYSIIMTTTTACLIALIGIGSAEAVSIILSVSVSGIYASYIPIGVLLLYRRCRGQISEDIRNDNTGVPINLPGADLVWGPFRVPGRLGILINAWAVIYTLIVIFFSFWPDRIHPTLREMNWSAVVFCGTCIFAIAYYALRARHVYHGPVFELRRF
ncbi:amino acid/polyamine transporter I [Penicillium angulare]|uniref:Amino acid/polyamine transporter I n=1 Tax=Penicillium angulare TaxID=116970 RepID=A0A9W9ETQ7_9EURO|nr:amino acid/polyamine transporter I [Penicillium angulare]